MTMTTSPTADTSGGGDAVPGPSAVLDLLRRQRDLYGGLHRLAARQRQLITGNDAGSLLTLLGDRHALTESLLEVGRELAPFRENWSAFRESLGKGDRAEADGLIAEVNQLLGQVITSDEEDSRLLSARKTQIADQLKSRQAERTAVAAYAAMAGPASSGASGRLNQVSEGS